MELKPSKEMLTIGGIIAALATGITYGIEDRYVTMTELEEHLHDPIYVTQPVFNSHVVYSEIRDLESRLDRLQDKLAAYMAIPEADLLPWQRAEIERLRSEIQRVRDKIERLG